jgi:Cu2+-exporting ATPase
LRRDGCLLAAFRFHESLRPGAVAAIDALRRRGLQFHILSGDHPEKVARIARDLGFDQSLARGALDPLAKRAAVEQLDRRDTLYLGDGANDSLAFDHAYVTGTPVVDRALLESKADFYTLGAGLAFLPGLLAVADARARAVALTFGFALAYNLATVAVCLAGRMHPLLAAVLMPISSVVSIVIVALVVRRNPCITKVESAEQIA